MRSRLRNPSIDGRGGEIAVPTDAAIGRNRPGHSNRRFVMNSIVFTHFAAPASGVSLLDLAFDRLGTWLDTERDTLERLLAQVGQRQAADALDMLHQLHLDPEPIPGGLSSLLEDARTCLVFLIETLRALPSRCRQETAWGLPCTDAFDCHVRWSGARLEDLLSTIDYALAA